MDTKHVFLFNGLASWLVEYRKINTMGKHVKTFLLIITIILGPFLQSLYARSLHFIAYGDTRRDINSMGKPQRKHHAIAKVIRDSNPDFILFSGDMVCYNEFDRFREVIIQNYTGEKMIPFYPVIGNHEVAYSEKTDALIQELIKKMGEGNISQKQSSPCSDHLNETQTFREKIYKVIDSIDEIQLKKRSWQVLWGEICDKLNPAYIAYLKEILGSTMNGQSWYSFIKETDGVKIKFIALNSSLPDDAEQFQWFLDELNDFSGPKIILAHYPPYSIGHHGCTDLLDKQSKASRFRDRYSTSFNNPSNTILLVICGHEHNYQRMAKTDKTGGVQLPVYIVSGGGGAELSGPGECDISQIPFHGFRCLQMVKAYQYVDVAIHSDEKNTVTLQCKVLGLRYDPPQELPDDDVFEKHFIKERLELIDDFSLHWQSESIHRGGAE
ncbi:MAG: hypothetical protein CV087_02600 [Candidatus Brocadia sp. WS118]|nr:MAG: hypothetical protein CV087_02600 [Candidatus Brocadia sp. WS118]